MDTVRTALEFWVELNAYIPRMRWQLHNFYQAMIG